MRGRRRFGDAGEAYAARHLERLGWVILARQYRVQTGEIDLVAEEVGEVVFVEVKTRRSNEVEPEESVGWQKLRRMERAAHQFLVERAWEERPHRFDVISIVWPEGQDPTLQH